MYINIIYHFHIVYHFLFFIIITIIVVMLLSVITTARMYICSKSPVIIETKTTFFPEDNILPIEGTSQVQAESDSSLGQVLPTFICS